MAKKRSLNKIDKVRCKFQDAFEGARKRIKSGELSNTDEALRNYFSNERNLFNDNVTVLPFVSKELYESSVSYDGEEGMSRCLVFSPTNSVMELWYLDEAKQFDFSDKKSFTTFFLSRSTAIRLTKDQGEHIRKERMTFSQNDYVEKSLELLQKQNFTFVKTGKIKEGNSPATVKFDYIKRLIPTFK